MLRYTLQWKIHCHSYTLPPVFSSSGHYSDGVIYVALEVSESGLSCCWVTEPQGGLIASLRMVGHTGGVEAAWSWAWTSPLPCYPDTWGICELNSDFHESGRGWSNTECGKLYKKLHTWRMYLLLVEKPFWEHSCYQSYDCHSQHKPRQCTLCCTGGWARWHWLLLYCSLCTSSESLPQVGSQLLWSQHTWTHPDVTIPMTL